MSDEHKPYISHEVKLPETTLKAFVLGALLSMILSAASGEAALRSTIFASAISRICAFVISPTFDTRFFPEPLSFPI